MLHAPALQVALPLAAAPLCLLIRHARLAWAFATLVSWGVLAIAVLLLLLKDEESTDSTNYYYACGVAGLAVVALGLVLFGQSNEPSRWQVGQQSIVGSGAASGEPVLAPDAQYSLVCQPASGDGLFRCYVTHSLAGDDYRPVGRTISLALF